MNKWIVTAALCIGTSAMADVPPPVRESPKQPVEHRDAPKPAEPGPGAASSEKPPEGEDLLKKMDAALNPFNDAIFESTLVIKEEGGKTRELSFKTWSKPSLERRLIRFTAPAELKGMGLLVESHDVVQVFLPGYKKVRKMSAHLRNQDFMGSDFSLEDISRSSFAKHYDATLHEQTAKEFILDLHAKKGAKTEYPQLRVWMEKETQLPGRLQYYDEKGKTMKSQERVTYTKDAGGLDGAKMVVRDRKAGRTSELTFKIVEKNIGMKDDSLTVAALKKKD